MVKNIAILMMLLVVACKGNSQEQHTEKKKEVKEIAYKVEKSDAEWRAELDDMEYYVLRRAGTEYAFTSDLLENKEKGTYVCAGCGNPVFKSDTKFKSGTGWPSFYQEIEGNVAFDTDYKIGYARTEEHCATCGGHLGHVFKDGPEPTGERHCINGAALDFIPDSK
ncbi:peptide-methionine (R)-S-oxide reductase [Croceivirga lutea]|uniref:peptide-methionine (R)-S-oxide reductase MsrB n=1 Tax=Croceivirga lutea TaxID=1775167 RepID=UPI00163B1A88|nr:peptide-methionine (R)-S-oxide reductase MsrB [Croceivirga lutea]GGG56755.1 peptide-methionine (R)-S-oxide reductase [Croceivirga lutea]